MNYPVTPAVRVLREKKIAFTPHLYTYEERGGTRHSAASLGVDEHTVIKTLVMETDARRPLLVLMHGDREVSTKELARHIGVKSIATCDLKTAQRVTGYTPGGIAPFGTKTLLPVYAESTIFDLPRILINGGKRGFLVGIEPKAIEAVLPVTRVSVKIVSVLIQP